MQKKLESLKYEIAEELGLSEKIKASGWSSLTPKETGTIGGLIASKIKKNVILKK